MNKRLENKINLLHGESLGTRMWLAKHWHRWITYGCSMCWIEGCSCSNTNKDINSPKGFAEISEYAYNEYGEAFRK
jgi:hypothetical protein